MTETLDLPAQTEQQLERFGFDRATFDRLRERLRKGEISDASNRVRGTVTPPSPADVARLPAIGSPERARLRELGEAALRRGEVAAIVLAGGMATRFGGVVKAAVEVAEGRTFLDLKLADFEATAKRLGCRVPVYLMTSFATDEETQKLAAAASSEQTPVRTFAQFISLRVNPDGSLFRDDAGEPSTYAPGHGDLSFALRRSGVLRALLDQGVRYLYMSNVDNLGATLEPAIVGAHIEAKRAITVEVTDKGGDKGGAPARVDGVLQVVEGFRFPEGFDQGSIPVFNTNTFVIDAAAIDRDFDLRWFAVQKQVDGRTCIQFERLVGELTAFLPCHVIAVARQGDDGRFLPVKDPAELEQRRDEIMRVLSARGAL